MSLDQSVTQEWDGQAWVVGSNYCPVISGNWGRMAFSSSHQKTIGIVPGSFNMPLQSYEYSGSVWSPISISGAPSARDGFSAAYCPTMGGVVVFGGAVHIGSATATACNEMWLLPGPPVPASVTPFGIGCAGTTGVPTLAPQAGSFPFIGRNFAQELLNLPPSVFSLAIGSAGFSRTQWQQHALPYDLAAFGMPGCSAFIDPALSQGIPSFGGHAVWQMALPNQAAFIGLTFYTQGMVLDFGANAANFIVSNALEWVIGRQ